MVEFWVFIFHPPIWIPFGWIFISLDDADAPVSGDERFAAAITLVDVGVCDGWSRASNAGVGDARVEQTSWLTLCKGG